MQHVGPGVGDGSDLPEVPHPTPASPSVTAMVSGTARRARRAGQRALEVSVAGAVAGITERPGWDSPSQNNRRP